MSGATEVVWKRHLIGCALCTAGELCDDGRDILDGASPNDAPWLVTAHPAPAPARGADDAAGEALDYAIDLMMGEAHIRNAAATSSVDPGMHRAVARAAVARAERLRALAGVLARITPEILASVEYAAGAVYSVHCDRCTSGDCGCDADQDRTREAHAILAALAPATPEGR